MSTSLLISRLFLLFEIIYKAGMITAYQKSGIAYIDKNFRIFHFF